jgi:hypothetical protein
MRVVKLIVLSFAAFGGASAQERPDEVIVRGRQVGELRVEVQQAREHAYAIFNEINSNNDFDVYCHDERKYHSRATRRVCRPQFENRISGQAATEFLSTLTARCQPDGGGAIPWQSCMFGDVGQIAKSNAQAVEGQAPPMHDRMNDEILRLAQTDQRFGQAILDFFEASQRYDAARGRRADEDED